MQANPFPSARPYAAILAVAACLAVAGCTTVNQTHEVTTRPEQTDTPTALMKELNYAVAVVPGDADARDTAAHLAETVNGQLAAAGYQLALTAPDVLLRLSVKKELFDRSGNYYRYIGRATASAEAADGRILNQETLVANAARALGKSAAEESLAAAFAAQTATWITRACAPQQLRLAAAEVAVKRPYLTSDHPRFISAFVRKVQAMKGVVNCRLAREDHDRGAFVFRVLYDQQAYPQGILNAVVLRLDELSLER